MVIFFAFIVLGLFDIDHILLYGFGGLVAAVIYRTAKKFQYCRVFLFYSGFQFVQIFSSLLYAKYMKDTPEHLFEIENIQWLIAWSMVQLVLMLLVTVGLLNRFVIQKVGADFDNRIAEIISKMNVYRVVWVYVLSTAAYALLMIPLGNSGSARQLMDITNNFVYVFCIFLLSSFVIHRKGWDLKKFFVVVILLIGFILSFSSYFSTFKIFFVCLLLASLGKLESMRLRHYFGLTVLVGSLTYFMVFWSLVKINYRFFTGTQEHRSLSTVDGTVQALGYLWDRFSGMDAKDIDVGVASLFYRVQYMEYYALVVKKTPAELNFQKGNELAETIEFLTTPRFLNPNKKKLDPSSKVNKFTGRKVTTAKQGVSISIGYFANLYIDYGLYLMTIPLLALAFLLFQMLKWIIKSFKANEYVKLSLVYSTVLVLGFFESDIDYYLGTVRNSFVLLLLLRRLPFNKIEAYLFPITEGTAKSKQGIGGVEVVEA